MPGPTRTSPAGSPCRCCGTAKREHHREQRNAPRSSACFNSAFDGLGAHRRRLVPGGRCAPAIDAVNDRVYDTLNNGVYKRRLRHARRQAYEMPSAPLFETLDWLEELLARQPLPRGRPRHRGRLAAVHHAGALRRGLPRPLQVQPPADHRLPRRCGTTPGRCTRCPASAETVDFDHITRHYYCSHAWVNPSRIVPIGPALDLDQPGTRVPRV